MIILRLFSKSEKDKERTDDGKKSAIKGAALTGGGFATNKVLYNKLKLNREGKNKSGTQVGKQPSRRLKGEHKRVYDKLKKEAEKQGTNVIETTGDNSMYLSKNMRKFNSLLGIDIPGGKSGDTIITGDRADTLAHELGHSKHYQKRCGSKLGKAAHRLLPISLKGTFGPLASVASMANGIDSGRKSARAKAKGEKESTWNKVRSVAVPAAVAVPLLVSEGAASKKGLKMLKNSKASKELQKDARKNLSKAYGTYVSGAVTNIGFGELGRAAGKNFESDELNLKAGRKKQK